MPSYLPSRDAELRMWADNFSTLITAAPATYGLVAGDATTIADVVTPFGTALDAATDPSTRTKVTVQTKETAKAAMLAVIRDYAMQIKNNTAVLDADKLALGLTLRDRSPTPIPAPVTSPLLNIVQATPLQHTLRFSDSATPDKRAKPPGAIALELVCSVGTEAPAGPELLPTRAHATRNPVAIGFDAADVGKTAFYYGRWITRRGLVGPWSAMASLTVVG